MMQTEAETGFGGREHTHTVGDGTIGKNKGFNWEQCESLAFLGEKDSICFVSIIFHRSSKLLKGFYKSDVNMRVRQN